MSEDLCLAVLCVPKTKNLKPNLKVAPPAVNSLELFTAHQVNVFHLYFALFKFGSFIELCSVLSLPSVDFLSYRRVNRCFSVAIVLTLFCFVKL